MKWEGREESSNVEDRRGIGGAGIALGGGGGLVVLILALVFGINPARLSQLVGNGGGGGGTPASAPPAGQVGQSASPEEQRNVDFTRTILRDTEIVWGEQFRAMGRPYPNPTLVLFSGEVNSACGAAESATGPFYCPGDTKVYIDLSFYRDMQKQLNATGDFARAYVIAHEVGHHVQKLLGYAERADRARASGDSVEAHHASVRLELQADFLAGVWANHAQQKFKYLEKGDIDSALNAANQIGDDRLQMKARGRVVPDSFTHGTSAQRQRWFKRGFDTGDVNVAAELFDLPYNRL